MLYLFFLLFVSLFANQRMLRVTPIHGKDIHYLDRKGFERGDSPGSFLVPEDKIGSIKSIKHVVRDDTVVKRAGYLTNAQINDEIAQMAASNDWISYRDIGRSVNNQPLRVARFQRVIAGEPQLEPRPLLRLIGNMHGDEVVSREVLVRFMRHLVQYADSNAVIGAILANTTIEIMPTMNPDGYDAGTRVNANGVDLNRAFPDHFEGWDCGVGCAPREVTDVMAWIRAEPPALTANFHGGAVVCNYPRDGNEEHMTRHNTPTPDDYLMREVCRAYASGNSDMNGSYLFRDGIVNGAYWYVLYGGLQDWVYDSFGVPSVTVELSTVKWPEERLIESKYWPENVGALTKFAQKAQQGVFGIVTDANTGAPLNAEFTFSKQERGAPFHSKEGKFNRALTTGDHYILVQAEGYSPREYHVEIENGKPFILNPKLTRVR